MRIKGVYPNKDPPKSQFIIVLLITGPVLSGTKEKEIYQGADKHNSEPNVPIELVWPSKIYSLAESIW